MLRQGKWTHMIQSIYTIRKDFPNKFDIYHFDKIQPWMPTNSIENLKTASYRAQKSHFNAVQNAGDLLRVDTYREIEFWNGY